MLVREITKRCTAECTEDTPLELVYNNLKQQDDGFVVVVDTRAHRIPIGIINEHSICEQLVGRRRDSRGLLAGNVMDPRISTILADSYAEDCYLIPEFTKDNFPIFVVDSNRRLCGILDKKRVPRPKVLNNERRRRRAGNSFGGRDFRIIRTAQQ